MRKLMYTFLVIFAVFVFASCNSNSSPSYGALTVHAGGESVARTIEPAVEKVTCSEYCIHMIYKDRNDVPEKTHSFTSTSTTVEGLLAGRWEAYVEGYNDDGTLIAVSESQIITVVQNQYASATFNLEYLSDGTGYMTMSVSIPAAMTDVAKLSLSLEAIDSSHQNYIFTVNRSDASVVGDNLVFSYPADYANQYYEIATGCYDVTLTLISSENYQVGSSFLESVFIYKDLISPFALTWSKDFLPRVSTPVIGLASGSVATDGTVEEGSTVTITCMDSDAAVYYTTDGTIPSAYSNLYSSPITLGENCIVKAIAIKSGVRDSLVASQAYSVKVKTPILTAGGTFYTVTTATASCATDGSTIYYSLGDTLPAEENWAVFPAEGIKISENTRINIVAVKSGLVNSESVTESYIIDYQNAGLSVVNPTRQSLSIIPSGSIVNNQIRTGAQGTLTAVLSNSAVGFRYQWYVDGVPAVYSNGTNANTETFNIGEGDEYYSFSGNGCFNIAVKAISAGKVYTENYYLEVMDESISLDNLIINGVEYSKTAETIVLENQITIVGSESDGVFKTGRTITLSPYIMGKYEITQDLFKAVMGGNPSKFKGSPYGSETQGLRPADNVTWYQAIAFCNKLSLIQGLEPVYSVAGISNWETLAYSSIPASNNDTWNNATFDITKNGYRLPTEAEWEFAARGGNPEDATSWNYLYSGSNSDNDVAWNKNNSSSMTHEVGLKEPNSMDIYDMCGNVFEWCQDGYVDLVSGTFTNPAGDSSKYVKIQRGGYFNRNEYLVTYRADYRACGYSSDYGGYGFRIVRSYIQ